MHRPSKINALLVQDGQTSFFRLLKPSRAKVSFMFNDLYGGLGGSGPKSKCYSGTPGATLLFLCGRSQSMREQAGRQAGRQGTGKRLSKDSRVGSEGKIN